MEGPTWMEVACSQPGNQTMTSPGYSVACSGCRSCWVCVCVCMSVLVNVLNGTIINQCHHCAQLWWESTATQRGSCGFVSG